MRRNFTVADRVDSFIWEYIIKAVSLLYFVYCYFNVVITDLYLREEMCYKKFIPSVETLDLLSFRVCTSDLLPIPRSISINYVCKLPICHPIWSLLIFQFN